MKNKQLTKNFKLFEFINAKMPAEAVMLNHSTIAKMDKKEYDKLISNITDVANELQKIRDKYGKPITITSGYRCIEWEKIKGRSGASQHIFGMGADFVIQDQEIMKSILDDYKSWMGGLASMVREGKIIFIHLDLRTPNAEHIRRGYGARWEY